MEPRKRLHVKVSRGCNNNCIFCLDDRPKRTDATVPEVERLLREHQHLSDVLFTCGEPTIHPDLPLFIEMARSYRSIGLVTNGRRLSYASYLERLLSLGLGEVTVSIHGSTPTMHDSATRTRGSFEQTSRGLANIRDARRTRDVRLVTSTVIHSRNADRLPSILSFLSTFEPDAMVLNVVEPSGEALEHFDRLVLPYERTAGLIREALSDLPLRDRVVVEGIPVCLCTGFQDLAGIREEIHLLEGDELRALPPDRNHAKPPACDGCTLTHLCPGVFAEYVRRRGWEGP